MALGLLSNYIDPEEAAAAGRSQGLQAFGAALMDAGRPRLILREGFGPGLLGGLGAGLSAFGQGAQQGRQQYIQTQQQDRALARESALNDALSDKPDDQLAPGAAQYRGLLGSLPAPARAAFGLLDPAQRGQVLAHIVGQQPQRQNVVVGPGGHLVDSTTGRSLFAAPALPRQATPPGPYDSFRVLPNGEIVDLRQLGGANGTPPATPAAPAGQPPLAPPSAVLPAPGAPGAGLLPSAAPDAAPAGDTLPMQGQMPGAPPAALPPGTVRPAPPPEWGVIPPDQYNRFMLPQPGPNQIWERNSRTGETRTRGSTGTNITTNVGERTTEKLVAEQWDNLEQGVRDSGRRERLYTAAEKAMQGFSPGVGADARLFFRQLAGELGIRVNGTADGEVLRQVQRNLELAATPKGQGQITENERKLIRDMVPIWSNTPEGVRAGLTLLRQLDAYDAQIAEIYRRNAAQNGGTPNPVTVRQQVAEFARQNPVPDVNAALSGYEQPMAGRIEPLPGAAQPVRVRTPEEARRLPSGTPILLPDGSQGRVP